jgi:hypothetical protein
MPDFTASTAVRNSGAAFNLLAAQASQTFDLSDVADERFLLVAQNDNADVDGGKTATITIAPGGFLSSVLGTLSVDIADAGASKIIYPCEGMRFKSTASKITVGVSVTQSGTVSSVTLGVIKLP